MANLPTLISGENLRLARGSSRLPAPGMSPLLHEKAWDSVEMFEVAGGEFFVLLQGYRSDNQVEVSDQLSPENVIIDQFAVALRGTDIQIEDRYV